MSNELTCPLCGSHDVECLGRPRGHVCRTCGYDGRTKIDTSQVVRSGEAAVARMNADAAVGLTGSDENG